MARFELEFLWLDRRRRDYTLRCVRARCTYINKNKRGRRDKRQQRGALPSLVFPNPELVVEEHGKIGHLGCEKSIFIVESNDVYQKLVEDRAHLTTKVLDTRHITQYVKWWC